MKTPSLADEFEHVAETLLDLAQRLRQAERQQAASQPEGWLPACSARLLLTIDETAELLSLGKSTIYELVARKELPAVKRGKSLRFARQDIEAYVERLRTPPEPRGVPSRIRSVPRRNRSPFPGRVVG